MNDSNPTYDGHKTTTDFHFENLKLKERINDLEKALEDLSFDCFGAFHTCAPRLEVYNRTFDVLKDTLDKPDPKPPKKDSVYGNCPICGSKGVSRERRLNGNDRCSKGHTYPSKDAKS